ncbi:MAG: HTR-like protein, partial [Haloarculaceae archaeon]
MAGTADRVRDLVDDDDQMAGVVQLVLDRAEDGAVTYGDVRDDVDSGRWGRLIDRGVLVEAGDEYVLRDPEGVREGLEEATKEESSGSLDIDMPDEPEGDSSWSIYDKAAAVGAVGLFAGYSIRSVRDVIGNTLDLLLGPLDAALPFYVVVMVLALFTGLYSTLLQANLMD